MPFDRKVAGLDDTDWAILDELQRDGRLPFSELGRRVSLSAPAVTERVRRLEQAGVITGYRAVVDPAALGAGIEAIVRVRVPHGSTERFRHHVVGRPEVLHCDHVTGDDCMVARVRTTSMARLEEIVGAVGTFGATTTTLVFSSEVRDRPVDRAIVQPAGDLDAATG
jgi:Lrp/AsnC family transcriptional regulator, leucine-responsive regulatory protein